ncbi:MULTISPECIES: helix-turn-helix domain-containing protein [unclassified Nocardioides]|uniref:helix-turn-helix domain-containing protein n=1 Tax=unclassified Nocardioides TaxID=2615069 RepID=UPI0000571935|nr:MULTISPECIES: helix-turn-helix domain-containing protein [unclassified Nocardioides]ABL83818.1 transcriptional regulator, ArsR family [Nocardioides sp. JS614]MBI2243648.1 helix-turn-helix domain-containing protein [Nocardioides sp.]
MAMYDDPRVLRAIAHPTRNRILSELYAAGSLRAADIARELGVPANQASFHLRQLAKYGLVEEAPDEARDRRDRVWRLVDPDGISFRTREMLDRPGGKAAYAVFQRNATAWGHHLVDRALAPDPAAGREKSVSEWALRLAPEEAKELLEEMGELVERWRRRSQDGPGERVTYSVYQLIQPYPELGEAGAAGESREPPEDED